MKALLRLALLTLCGAAGILIAVHVAGSRPAETAAVPAGSASEPVGVPASADRPDDKADAEPPKGGTPTEPQPRIAAQFPTIPGLPAGVDVSNLSNLSPEQLDRVMQMAVPMMRQMQQNSAAGGTDPSAGLLQMLQGGGAQPAAPGQANQLNSLLQAIQTVQQPGAGPALNSAQITPAPVKQPEALPPGAQAPADAPSAPAAVAAPAATTTPPAATIAGEMVPPPPKITADDDGRLSIHSRDDDVRNLLEQLAEQAGLNVLAGESVTGTVTVSLQNVTVDEAFAAVLKSTGFVSRRDGNVLYIGTTADFDALEKSLDRIGTRVYRPNYLNAKELSSLITPLLTPSIGKVSVTAPPAVGIAADNTGAGGDSMAQQDALVVQDYERVLDQIDQVYRELDRRPSQVSIEAVIVSVTLDDENKFGVDFQVLRDKQNVRFGWGNPRQAPLAGGGNVDSVTGANIGEFAFDTGGLKFAFLDDSLGVFLNALESVGDANVVASPKLLCLNKQKAEILIGQRLGYISTTVTQNFSTQNVEFLDVGAQLRLRPYISSDGLIRMEVHPELSEGEVVVSGGFTLPRKTLTEVTTNVMCPNGCTVIIGGLMRENLRSNTTQVPLMGSLPLVGPLFRNKTENVERTEILVLLTPRIVENGEIAAEGAAHHRDTLDMESAKFHRMNPVGKAHLSRDYLLRAQEALRHNDRGHAQRYARLAVHYDPLNRDAVRFYSQLGPSGGEIVSHGWGAQALVGDDAPAPATVDGREVPDWMLDELQTGPPAVPLHPRDPGIPGRDIEIVRPEVFGNDRP